jgi:AraC-like DNA-binding protein
MVGFFQTAVTAPNATQAERRLRERYGDVALGGVGGYREQTVGDGRFAVSQVLLEGEFEVDADVRVVTVAFSTPGYRWRAGGDEGDLSQAPALFQPGTPMSSRLTGRTGVTTVTFDVAALSALAESTYGTPTAVDFTGAQPVSRELGRVWTKTVGSVLENRGIENDLTRAHTYRALGTMTLEAFRLGGDRGRRDLSPRGALVAYRRATEFVDEHLSLPISEADIAQAAGVSVAELRVVFAAHSAAGWMPAQHLRQARLAAAHLDLLDGDPARGDRVSDILARWGFTNSERFAPLYRAAFGTTPGAVLRG